MNQTAIAERLQVELRQWSTPRGTKAVLDVGQTYRHPPTPMEKARGGHTETRTAPRFGIEVREAGAKTTVTFRANPKLTRDDRQLDQLAAEVRAGLLEFAAVSVAGDDPAPNGPETAPNGDSPAEAPVAAKRQQGRPRGSKKKLTTGLMHERRQARGGHGKGPVA